MPSFPLEFHPAILGPAVSLLGFRVHHLRRDYRSRKNRLSDHIPCEIGDGRRNSEEVGPFI